MDYGGSALIFNFADNLDCAKLLVVFVVHGLALSLLLFIRDDSLILAWANVGDC